MHSVHGEFQSCFSTVPSPVTEEDDFYLTTTEHNDNQVLDAAAKSKVGAAKVALFTSGFFGLNLASVRDSATSSTEGVEYLLNVDYSSTVEYFWEHVKPIIVSNDRKGTIAKINDFIFTNRNKLFPGCSCCSVRKAESGLRNLQREISQGTSWLSSDERFQKIQSIFKANKFACVRADLTDEKATEEIARNLAEKGLTLDTIYVSNIREYTECDDKLALFQKAMEKLKSVSTKETLVVDTAVRDKGSHSDEKQMQQIRKGFVDATMQEYFPASPNSACPKKEGGEEVRTTLRPGGVIVIDPSDLFAFIEMISGGRGGVVVITQGDF